MISRLRYAVSSLRWQPSRIPKIDPRDTGVTFVDVLFAIVVGKILDVSVSGKLPPAAIGHLLLGAVLTITSWVGYHNSVNRVKFFLWFWNLPIFLFAVDILLVYAYWLMPVMTVHYEINGHAPRPQAIETTAFVTAAASLYVVWDYVALCMRKSGKYPDRPMRQDIPGRRYASILLLVISAITFVVVACTDPHTDVPIIAIDASLIVLLLLYRTFKEGLTPPGSLDTKDDGGSGTPVAT